jgi:hypothetical protein
MSVSKKKILISLLVFTLALPMFFAINFNISYAQSTSRTPTTKPATGGSKTPVTPATTNTCQGGQATDDYVAVCTDLGSFYNIGSYIAAITSRYVIPLAVIASLVVISFAGFQYIYSGGSPESIKLSKELIIGAILGLALIFMASFIIDEIISTDELNVDINATSWVQPSLNQNQPLKTYLS